MKVNLTPDGQLEIKAENDTESYALHMWANGFRAVVSTDTESQLVLSTASGPATLIECDPRSYQDAITPKIEHQPSMVKAQVLVSDSEHEEDDGGDEPPPKQKPAKRKQKPPEKGADKPLH